MAVNVLLFDRAEHQALMVPLSSPLRYEPHDTFGKAEPNNTVTTLPLPVSGKPFACPHHNPLLPQTLTRSTLSCEGASPSASSNAAHS
jgi:hypothetical protein